MQAGAPRRRPAGGHVAALPSRPAVALCPPPPARVVAEAMTSTEKGPPSPPKVHCAASAQRPGLIFVQGHRKPMTPQAFSDMQRWGHELENPSAFTQIPEEKMRQLRYNVETAEWTETTVLVKVENHVLGFGGMKAVQRAFKVRRRFPGRRVLGWGMRVGARRLRTDQRGSAVPSGKRTP